MEAKPVKSRNVCVVFNFLLPFVSERLLCLRKSFVNTADEELGENRPYICGLRRVNGTLGSLKIKERKTNRKMWICSRSVPSGPRRSQTCDRANTVLLVSSFTASAITTKKSKVFCTYTFWPLLHGKADFSFFWLAWTCGTRQLSAVNSVLLGEPGASSAVKVHF